MVHMENAQLAYLAHAASLSVLDNDEIQFHLLSPGFNSKRKSEVHAVSTVSSSHSQRCMWSSNSWEEKWGEREGELEPLRDSHHATPCVCSYLRRQTASVDFLRMLSSAIGSQWDSSDGSLCQWMDCPLEALLLVLGLSMELCALLTSDDNRLLMTIIFP